MKRLIALSLAVLFLLVLVVQVQAAELATYHLDLVLPTGQHLIGDLSMERGLDGSDRWSLTGTVNGVAVSGKGTATESWTSESSWQLTIVSVDEWTPSQYHPPVGVTIDMTNEDKVVYTGFGPVRFPVAVSQTIQSPVEGQVIEISVGNITQTSTIVMVLPFTGDYVPIVWLPILVIVGITILVLSLKPKTR